MRTVIHIGLHRTGTTFLQKEIFPKLDGIKYVYSKIINSETKGILISEEGLSGIPTKLYDGSEVYSTVDSLSRLYPDAKIILCIRNKDIWVRSVYSQYIKSGGTKTFKQFKVILNPIYLDFDSYIRYLMSKFKDVYICHHEDLVKDHKKFIGDMCKFIGVKVPEYTNKVHNKGFTNNQLRILRFLNKLSITDYSKVGLFQHKTLRMLLSFIRSGVI